MLLTLMHINNFHHINNFGVGNSYSVHVGNKKKNALVLGEGRTQRLDDTAITEQGKDSDTFTESGKRFVLSPHCNRCKFLIC